MGASALVIEGGAGIGKTTLWFEMVRAAGAGGYRVLQARPAESEAKRHVPGPGMRCGSISRGRAALAFCPTSHIPRQSTRRPGLDGHGQRQRMRGLAGKPSARSSNQHQRPLHWALLGRRALQRLIATA